MEEEGYASEDSDFADPGKDLAVPESIESFIALSRHHGGKLPIKLKGGENFAEWHQEILFKTDLLLCNSVLTGEGKDLVSDGLWKQMKV